MKRGSWKKACQTERVTAKFTSWPIRSMSSNGPMRKPPDSRMTRVQRGDVAAALAKHAQGLGIERPRHAIDDKARRGLRTHRCLAPGGGGGEHRFGHGRIGGGTAHDLDQRHGRNGVEEVHADEASGTLQGRAERRHGDGGGVGGEDGVGRDNGLQRREQLLLDREILDHGLDDETGTGKIRRRGHG